MRADESYPIDALRRGDSSKQIPEAILIVTIGIYRLAKQSDLASPFTYAVADLAEDLFCRMIDLAPSHVWHDAVRAGIVTATHDRDEGGHFVVDGWNGIIEFFIRFAAIE